MIAGSVPEVLAAQSLGPRKGVKPAAEFSLWKGAKLV